jgi:hypothetical protein
MGENVPSYAQKVGKRAVSADGIIMMVLGAIAFFFFRAAATPYGGFMAWTAGGLLVLYGLARFKKRYLCSVCGNPATPESRICPFCGAHFYDPGQGRPQ